MKRATALVFPSLLEGFGLPVLEAFAAGTPVITSNISSLPEVAGDAAIMVDPFDTQAISEAMLDIINDEELANTLKKKGTQRAKEYTWDRTAAMTIEVYRQVLVV
jgi:alpha-1,3-rhamnosyl/mannosyltransferase